MSQKNISPATKKDFQRILFVVALKQCLVYPHHDLLELLDIFSHDL